MTGGLPPDQTAQMLRMLAVLAIGTALARPLALRLVPGGAGWIAGVLLAWAVIGWVPWALAALWLVPFSHGTMAGLAVLAALRLISGGAPGDMRGAATTALAFAGLFWLGLAQRLGQADLTGLEKFTDMAFLAASMRSDWMPPQDPWFAGEPVNYYYVGHAMAATWGKVAGAAPDHAYQLAMAMLFALTGLAVFRVTVALAAPCGERLAAVLGAAAVPVTLYGGNLHSAIYTLFRPWLSSDRAPFHYPDSTRFIGFDPPVADKGFTEFVAYAFAVGDLHAHVIATPVFLLGLSILLTILKSGLQAARGTDLLPALGLGWCLGLCVVINPWDFAILGLLSLVVALVLAVRPHLSPGSRLDGIGYVAVLALGAAFVTSAPFLGSFTPFASGVETAGAQTPVWQLLTVYGHALTALLLFLALLATGKIGTTLLPVGCIFVGAILLIAIPETVIVRDIYGIEYARANTMFKLSFRAQTLLAVAALATLAPAVLRGGRWFATAFAAAIPVVATLAYLPHIHQPPSVIRSLDGLRFLREERALVAAASALPLAPDEALIEASGPAFGDTARVSAMTGQPTVIGWAGHEWLWRGDPAAPYARAGDVARFYGSTDRAVRCAILRRYNVRYVILGQVERAHYPDLNVAAIRQLGTPVHADEAGEIVAVLPDRCAD